MTFTVLSASPKAFVVDFVTLVNRGNARREGGREAEGKRGGGGRDGGLLLDVWVLTMGNSSMVSTVYTRLLPGAGNRRQ